MPRINSNSSFDDDDTYWDNNYDDDVIADEPSNIKNKPLPAIPVAERNNQYINSTDDYFKFKIKFDFDASSYGEGYLSLKSGDELYSESDDAISGWITVQYKGESGLVPFNYLEPYWEKLQTNYSFGFMYKTVQKINKNGKVVVFVCFIESRFKSVKPLITDA